MRYVVLAIAVVFIVGLGVLTVIDIVHYGLTGISVLALIVVALFTFGILGALREPPRQ